MVVILAVQMLPSTALLIPMFAMFNSVDLLGSYAALVLAYVATVLPFSIWVMRGFFVTIPAEIEEAARMDGASTWRVLTSVLFPLVAPGVISTGIFFAVSLSPSCCDSADCRIATGSGRCSASPGAGSVFT